MNARCLFAAVTMIGLLAPTTALADRFQTFSGDNFNKPRWNRPAGSGPNISPNNVRYSVQRFVLLNDSDCVINGAQDFDGYLHLYSGAFNPNNQLVNLLDGDDDAELGIGTSRIPADLDVDSVFLPAGIYFLVSSGFGNTSEGSFQNLVTCNGTVQPLHGACPQYFNGIPLEQQVCLGDRFVVAIQWATAVDTGTATPVRTGSNDTAIFWFFNGSNWEVMIKVLNACGFNSRFWVFGGALTNQEYLISVGDAQTGQVNTYFNPLNNRSPAIADTNAFATCP